MSQMFKIYSFQYDSDKAICAEFWGPSEWQQSGADHSCNHALRREWAQSLVNSFPDAWRALPEHPYLDFLSRNGFNYEEYLVRPASDTVLILCRTTQHVNFAL